ncbi:hypothetical protein [Streptomyces sp. NPDC018947]|uniref:hypothetical protein n=1 Tax=Streptomyces sp. NPDC018947 TaxID=3365054 RepID=UPI0037ACAFD0
MTGPAGALPPPPGPAGGPVTTIGPRTAGTTGSYPPGRGIGDGTSCLSTGREDADDLIADPSRAADAD